MVRSVNSIKNASFFPVFTPSVVAVVVVKLAADDVVAQTLNLLPVRVKPLHSSRETSAAGQVQVFQRGAILEQARQRLQPDGCVAKVEFPERNKDAEVEYRDKRYMLVFSSWVAISNKVHCTYIDAGRHAAVLPASRPAGRPSFINHQFIIHLSSVITTVVSVLLEFDS